MYKKLVYFISSALVLSLARGTLGQTQTGTGWRGEYYHFSGATPPTRVDAFQKSVLVAVRVDPQIYCYWNPGFQPTHPDGLKPDFTIRPPEGLRADNFAIRWLGEVEALKSEDYRFITGSDDGIRVWFDGKLIIDNWTNHDRAADTSNPIQLVSGCTLRYSNEEPM